ncbi:unnamed protein product [Cuscuta epithymum]|uniref:Uncharacterized protein n=1 Tax=Cuscuta epithymum TaxID=186058 RepID=A0AAV0D317_9ASTE|nr:unnamed protein product [Cuscuta epithymum]
MAAALDKKPNGIRIQGVGHFITPTMYFHMPIGGVEEKDLEKKLCDRRYDMMIKCLDELKAEVRQYACSDIGSCSVQEKSTTSPKRKRKATTVVEKHVTPLKKQHLVSRKSPRRVSKETESETQVAKDEDQHHEVKRVSRKQKNGKIKVKEVEVEDVRDNIDDWEAEIGRYMEEECEEKQQGLESQSSKKSPQHFTENHDPTLVEKQIEDVREELEDQGVVIIKQKTGL